MSTATSQSSSRAPTMRVFGYRSGQISFIEGAMGSRGMVTDGALLIAVGPADIVGPTVRGLARLAYDNETYLVPGCPEAQDDEDAAFKAFMAFHERVRTALARKGVHPQPVSRRRARK